MIFEHRHRSFACIVILICAGLLWFASPVFSNVGAYHERGHEYFRHGQAHDSDDRSPHAGAYRKGYGHNMHAYRGHAAGYGTYSHGYRQDPHRTVSEYIHHILQFKDAMAITDEQAAKLEEIETAYRKERIRLKADIAVANVELHQLLRDDDTPLSAIEQKLQSLYALKAKLHLAGIKAKRDANAVLTEEQRKRMKIVHERIEAAMSKYGAHPDGYPHRKGREKASEE